MASAPFAGEALTHHKRTSVPATHRRATPFSLWSPRIGNTAAALRWHGRLELEATTLTLEESQFALAALVRLRVDPHAAALLKTLLRQARPTLVHRFS